jgi:hypothetical protein
MMNRGRSVHDDHPGAEELAQRLEAYASARLSPNRKASARIRSAVIEEARMRALEASLGESWRSRGSGARRVMALLVAAVLILGSAVAVFAESAPGSPLYQARIWLEGVTLPADADARALERIRQVDERLVDSERAAVAADAGGVTAATDAYEAALNAAVDDAGTDPDRISRLEATLGHHVEVLESLAEKLPDAAAHGIQRAIVASQKAVDKLDKAKPQPGANGNGDPQNGKPENPGKP